MLMLPHSPPHPTCRYRCRQVLTGSRISNPMYVLMCPVTAQYLGEFAAALAVWYLTIWICWPPALVVLASSAQDIWAGTTPRLAMSELPWLLSVGTSATL